MRTSQAAALFLCVVSLTGCFSSNNPDALRERTADVTAAAKHDAGQIAKGVIDGLRRKGPIDINRASTGELMSLPGIGSAEAGSIVAGRPYTNPQDLVRRHSLTRAEFDRIQTRIVAKP